MPFIKQYWAIENTLKSGDSYSYRIVPSGLPELILYINHKPNSQQRSMEAHCLLNGQHDDFYDLQITESLSVFSVSFQPLGLRQFFKLPVNELNNRSVPLSFINKIIGNEWEGKISEAGSFEEKTDFSNAYFLRLLAISYQNFEFGRINNSMAMIKKTQGMMDINALSHHACLSRKQYEREFIKHIGMPPKQYLKIIRFQSAIYNRSRNIDLSMTELAYQTGYYDQSHLTNEFKTFSGLTPKQYYSNNNLVSDFFN